MAIQKKCVILVAINNDKSKKEKAMRVAAATMGVRSISVKNDELEVVGVGVDWQKLINRLKKEVGNAELKTEVDMGEELWTPADARTKKCTIL